MFPNSELTITPMKRGYLMRTDMRVPEQKLAHDSGEYEPSAMAKCLELMPPNGVFLDIGANVGFFTCAVASRLRAEQGGRVYAFEPVSANAARLRENIRLNRLEEWVTVVPAALGKEPGRLRMHVVPQGSANNAVGDNMLAPHDRQNIAAEGWRTDEADILTLDAWTKTEKLTRCDVIKIDVEGAELLVFEGGKEFLARMRPTILAECNPYWMRQIGQSFADVMAFFSPLGYEFRKEIDGVFVPVTADMVAGDLEVPLYLLSPK